MRTTLAIIASIASIVFRGFVVSKLWLWFLVHGFSLPAISVAQAVGISVLADLLTHQISFAKDRDADKSGNYRAMRNLFVCWATPAFALLVGFIARQFV